MLCELYDKIHPTVNASPTVHENFHMAELKENIWWVISNPFQQVLCWVFLNTLTRCAAGLQVKRHHFKYGVWYKVTTVTIILSSDKKYW